jgi:hypothetical protein
VLASSQTCDSLCHWIYIPQILLSPERLYSPLLFTYWISFHPETSIFDGTAHTTKWTLHLCTCVSTNDDRRLLLSSLYLPPHIYDIIVHEEDERQWTEKTRECDFFYVHMTSIVTNFLIIKPTRCTNFSNLFWKWNSTCFGEFLCPSSAVIHCTLSSGVCHTEN